MIEKGTLRKKAYVGAGVIGLSTLVLAVGQFIQLFVLGRVLEPAEFGLIALLSVVSGFSQMFMDLGFGNAILQARDVSKQQLSTLYWLNFLAGGTIGLCLYGGSGFVAGLLGNIKLEPHLQLLAALFPLVAIGQQFNIILRKQLKFGKAASAESISAIICLLVTIGLAVEGFGVSSYVWGQIAMAASRTLLFVYFSYKSFLPELEFSLDSIQNLFGFAFYQIGERTVNYWSSNVDYVVISHVMGAEAVGVYMVAYQLITIPVMRLNPILTKVALPVFSLRQEDNSALARGFLEMTRLVAYVTFPLLAGLACLADLFIPVLVGEGWDATISVVRILVGVGILRSLSNLAGSVYLAKGRADIGFKLNSVALVLNTISFIVLAKIGLEALALGFVGLTLLYFIAGRKIMEHIIGLSLRAYLSELRKPLLSSISMVASLILLRVALPLSDSVLGLVAYTFCGALIYLGCVWLFAKNEMLKWYMSFRRSVGV